MLIRPLTALVAAGVATDANALTGGRPRRITPADLRDAITRRLTAQEVSADHLARVLIIAPIKPERPRYTIEPDAGAIAFVAVADGEPLPAELTDDDISPAQARQPEPSSAPGASL